MPAFRSIVLALASLVIVCVLCVIVCVYLNCKPPWPRLVILTMTYRCVCVCVFLFWPWPRWLLCVLYVIVHVFASMVSRLGLGLGWLD